MNNDVKVHGFGFVTYAAASLVAFLGVPFLVVAQILLGLSEAIDYRAIVDMTDMIKEK